jgi:hypothetical protein
MISKTACTALALLSITLRVCGYSAAALLGGKVLAMAFAADAIGVISIVLPIISGRLVIDSLVHTMTTAARNGPAVRGGRLAGF